MMWLAIMGVCTLGAMALSGDENKSSSTTTAHTSNEVEFTKDYVRNNLSSWYYTNWQCEDIAYQLQDNWLKDDLEYLMMKHIKC